MIAQATRPLRLDAGSHAWLVVEGTVDVFAAEVTVDGDGPRHYLWSADVGDVIPPASRKPDARYVLTAVGMGTTRLKAVPLAELARSAYAEAIDRLIASVAPLLVPAEQVSLQEILTAGTETRLSKGQRAAVRERALWISHLEGSTRIGALEELEVGAADGWIPLQGAWVAATNDARLRSLDTHQYLSEAGDLRGLKTLIDLLQLRLDEEIEAGESVDARRLEAKAASDHRIWRGALGRLASLLQSERPVEHDAAHVPPLLAACRAVGSAAGIEIREPPRWEIERNDNLLPAICRASRVRSRRVALRGEWWRGDAGPLLGFLKEDQAAVALLPAKGGRYSMLDPRSAERQAVTAEVAAAIQPFAVTFYRPLPDSARSVRDLLGFALPLVKADLARVASAALAGGLLALVIPFATAHVFNEVIPNARPGDLLTILVALTAAAAGIALFDITRAFAQSGAEFRASAAIQAALVDRLLALPVPFFRRYSVGDLSGRASSIQAAQAVAGTSTLAVVLTSAFSLVNLLVLFYYDWRLALMTVGLLGATGIVSGLLVRATMRNERLQQEAEGRVSGLVHQILSGISKLRVSGSEARAFAAWSSMFSRQRELAQRAGWFKVLLLVFNEALPVACAAALYVAGGWMIFRQGEQFRTGDFLAFAAAFGTLFAATVAMSGSAVSLVSAMALLERSRPILETGPEVTESKSDPGALHGLVEGAHLTFRYSPDSPLVLDDVSFRAEPGQFVACVGPSGSGKSTTLRLLLGFETPETGAIYYDGQDLAALDISAIRNQQIGVVLQSSRLLAGDIFTNIVGATSTLTLEDAWEAAEATGLADDIRDMPMGMHTMISDAGSTFSGGQRQRLLIARALVRKPRIIFFDEATSALDNRTQDTVTRTLELSSATRFVIAHRLSTIRSADRIYVMDRGKIVEEGSFDELARGKGLFSRLIARQQT